MAQRRFASLVREHRERPDTYHIVTYGCQMNDHDSETLAGFLRGMGMTAAQKREDADLVIVNTCCVRENAQRRALGNITWLKEIKRRRPHMKIGVCGCMMQQRGMAEKVLRQYPFVDLAFGTGNLYRLPEYLYLLLDEKRRVIDVSAEESTLAEGLPTFRESPFKAYINIIYGCDNFCSYCIVPYVRGRERSRKAEDILREAEVLVKDGVMEITLLGQNVNSYGKDRGSSLPSCSGSWRRASASALHDQPPRTFRGADEVRGQLRSCPTCICRCSRAATGCSEIRATAGST